MTLDSFFGSALAGALTGLAAFTSVFLVVTGTFNFSGADLTARDEVFAFDPAAFADADFAATGWVTTLAGALVGVVAVRVGFVAVGLAATPFFTAGLAIDLPEAALVAPALAFFAAGVAALVCFAGFFIAFAMESIPYGCSRAPSELRFDGADRHTS